MKKSNFVRTLFAATLLVHGLGLTFFWFLRVRYGTDRRNVNKKTTSDVYIIYAVYQQKIIRAQILCSDSNRGLASTTPAYAYLYTTLGKRLLSTPRKCPFCVR